MDALVAALGKDFIQTKLKAAHMRKIEQLARTWEPLWTHGTFRPNLVCASPLQTVWPINQKMFPPDRIILHPIIQSVLMQPPSLAGWDQLFELEFNQKKPIKYANQLRREMIEFMEFREMAM